MKTYFRNPTDQGFKRKMPPSIVVDPAAVAVTQDWFTKKREHTKCSQCSQKFVLWFDKYGRESKAWELACNGWNVWRLRLMLSQLRPFCRDCAPEQKAPPVDPPEVVRLKAIIGVLKRKLFTKGLHRDERTTLWRKHAMFQKKLAKVLKQIQEQKDLAEVAVKDEGTPLEDFLYDGIPLPGSKNT